MEIIMFIPAALMLLLAGILIAEGVHRAAAERKETPQAPQKTAFDEDLAALLGYQVRSVRRENEDLEEGE